MKPLRIPASYMRGGTSKGVFFVANDLPDDPVLRDRLLLRVIGSPDRYGKQIDGMGAATSSTSKVIVVWPSTRPGIDIEYLFGQVAIDRPLIDWSGNCGNLTTAVAPFAIARRLVAVPAGGMATVRLWQATLAQTIVAHVPIADGAVVEDGDFELDGVSFDAAEIALEFLEPGDAEAPEGPVEAMFPTGRVIDQLDVPGLGSIEATLITAGNPTVFVDASAFGLAGTEMQPDLPPGSPVLAALETARAHAAVAMGLAPDAATATRSRPATPKICFISAAQDYTASDRRPIDRGSIDLCARILSMGALHHAMTGTGAIAIAVAAAVPGTIVSRRLSAGHSPARTVFGHPSGKLAVGAQVRLTGERWVLVKALMSRTARLLMEGEVSIPASTLQDDGQAGR
jgi:probable AcnD-accessory protein PrpF